jgi:hypothetical protein
VDSPEARTTCTGAGRKGHRALETERLATGKKNVARLGAHLVFADESGFLLAPLVAKTWAPRGCTPFQRHRQGRRDKISVISGFSLSPQRHRLGLYYLLFYDNIAQEEVCVFLRELLRHLRGRSLCCWIILPPTKGNPSGNSCARIHVSPSSTFPPRPRNSTPMKESALWPSDNWPTVGPMTSMSLWRMSSGQWRGSEGHAQNYAAASSSQNSLFFCASHCII